MFFSDVKPRQQGDFLDAIDLMQIFIVIIHDVEQNQMSCPLKTKMFCIRFRKKDDRVCFFQGLSSLYWHD